MNRTRQEFVDLHVHQFAGLLLDAVTQRRQDSDLSLWLAVAMQKIRDRLGAAYDDLTREQKPAAKAPANGQAQTQVRK